MTVSTQLRDMVQDRIQADVDKINLHFKTTLTAPQVAYDVRGQTAGYVTSKDGRRIIHLNAILLNENVDEMVNQTTPHELAHWAEFHIYGGHQYNGRKRSIHGTRWKAIMRVLGLQPDRCHNMDVSSAQTRKKNKFEYICACGKSITVGPVVHKKMVNGQKRWHCTGKSLTYAGALGKVSYEEARGIKEKRAASAASQNSPTIVPPAKPKRQLGKPAPRKVAVRNDPTASKKVRAQDIFDTHHTHSRELVINMFMQKLAMTKAGATTYYYNCSKR